MQGRVDPELKEFVMEASRALAQLDVERLEELALSCQALNRELPGTDEEMRRELYRQAKESTREMAVFRRVLDATRANLQVMNRLWQLRAQRIESSYGLERWTPAENSRGDN